MQQKTAWIIVIAVAVLIIVAAVVLFLVPRPTPTEVEVQEPANAVQELTEGTTASDIAKDLEALLQEEQVLGDIEAQLQQMEQQLQAEGL